MVTIHDIAKKAKVSSATVSRVLNDGPVSPSTKKRILRIIEKEKYVPDNQARYLKKLKTTKIGLIVPDISNPGTGIGAKVIHDILKTHGYHLIFGNTYGEVSEEKDILEMMERERVIGIILSTYEGEDDTSLYPFFEKLIKNGVSIVFMGKKRDNLPVDVISVNNFSGTFKIVEYLIKTGRKKIGFIAGKRNLRATEERLKGYIEALKNKGISPSSELIICDGEYTIESGGKFAKFLLKKRVDAIVCGNDLIAIGAIKTAEEMGIKVPEEVGITGFDDVFLASLIKPKLTTVHQPIEKIAITGCEFLLKRIEGELKEEPKEILIEPELIVRESA